VATPLSSELRLPAPSADAYALLTDPDYVTAVGEGTGGTEVEVTVTPTDDGGAVVVSRRVLPAELPSYAKAVVGDTVRLTETRTYGPAGADGSRSGTTKVAFEGAPVTLGGTLELGPDGAGSVLRVEGQVAASIPFVGGKIEKFAVEQVERALAKEEQVASEHLA
jgi:hypothetical protein